MNDQAILEAEPILPTIEPAVELLAAARTSGKSLLTLGRDLIRTIRRSNGKVSMADYFYYRLWDDAYSSEASKLAFIGRQVEPVLHSITADLEWIGVFHDKFLNYQILQQAGFPVPETIALYRHGGPLRKIRSLTGTEALADFLREQSCAPWFGKPVTGIRSTGTMRAEAYDSSSDELILAGGKRVTTDLLAGALSRYSSDGYLFQKVLAPHPEVARLTAGRLASARLVILLPKGRSPCLYRALIKLPVGSNIADNFWRSGNLLAALDAGSGRITRVVSGVGHQTKEIDVHPDSGLALRDARVPDWQEAVDMCLAASNLFPRIRMQAWDIALCDNGPVLMEANVGGDFNLPQIAHAEGMFAPEFQRFLSDCLSSRGKPINKAYKRLGLAAD